MQLCVGARVRFISMTTEKYIHACVCKSWLSRRVVFEYPHKTIRIKKKKNPDKVQHLFPLRNTNHQYIKFEIKSIYQ